MLTREEMRQFENWLLYKIDELYKINIIILIMSHANWTHTFIEMTVNDHMGPKYSFHSISRHIKHDHFRQGLYKGLKLGPEATS